MPTALEKAEQRLANERRRTDERRFKRVLQLLQKAEAELNAGEFYTTEPDATILRDNFIECITRIDRVLNPSKQQAQDQG